MLTLLAAKAFDSSILDIKFYVILVLLAVAVITVCCLFARSEKFKLKSKGEQSEPSYIPPVVIKVKDKKR